MDDRQKETTQDVGLCSAIVMAKGRDRTMWACLKEAGHEGDHVINLGFCGDCGSSRDKSSNSVTDKLLLLRDIAYLQMKLDGGRKRGGVHLGYAAAMRMLTVLENATND